jgi:hypothetical protein
MKLAEGVDLLPAIAALVVAALLGGPADLRAQEPVLPEVELTAGMVIDRSVRIRPGAYHLPSDSLTPAVTIRGSNIVVEFGGAELAGAAGDADPDGFDGVGILIDGGRDVTLRNARVRGYRVAVLARGVTRLLLDGNDVSHNWKPRLYSGIEKESLADWLSYHRNEKDEWLRYGAGIYLADVDSGEVRGTRARQGMNGLMLSGSRHLRIWNNDLSHMSGICIGLYRSSHNVVMHNRADWCVRGHSEGFFNRGQDSAALLLYEQSSHNVVAYNSMTHSGDGLFLWAGQTTMDSGAGGSNDNLFFGNDFSHAPTNGMEATFSRNAFVANRVDESAHGLWGGYSFESLVLANRFAGNRIAVAIEHGQDNRIASNLFDGDTTAVRLWWNRIEPSDWGYPKHRDTRSRDYAIDRNLFRGNRVALRVDATQGVRGEGNGAVAVDTLVRASGDTSGWALQVREHAGTTPRSAPRLGFAPEELLDDSLRAELLRLAPAPLAGGMDPMLPPGASRGRATIIVDEWGPYDHRSPKLWPELGEWRAWRAAADSGRAAPLTLRVHGPSGHWRLIGTDGVAATSAPAGAVPGTIVVTPATGRAHDFRVELEYVGGGVVSPRGDSTGAGVPHRFEWQRRERAGPWEVRFVTWDSTTDPRTDSTAFRRHLAQAAPAAAVTVPRLDYTWWRPQVAGVPQERVATVATGMVEVPAEGEFELVAIADDAVRVWVGGRLLIDHWEPHESAVDRAPIAAGRHEVRVEHYQVDGWTELVVRLEER